jgi:hypothetical protein
MYLICSALRYNPCKWCWVCDEGKASHPLNMVTCMAGLQQTRNCAHFIFSYFTYIQLCRDFFLKY